MAKPAQRTAPRPGSWRHRIAPPPQWRLPVLLVPGVAPMLKVQHPDYELYQTSIHAYRGVACSDCLHAVPA